MQKGDEGIEEKINKIYFDDILHILIKVPSKLSLGVNATTTKYIHVYEISAAAAVVKAKGFQFILFWNPLSVGPILVRMSPVVLPVHPG